MKALIVDDHAMMREGVATVLRTGFADAVVLQASDGAAALMLAAANADLDIVLLDLVLPGTDGMAVLATFGTTHPGLPVVVLSGSEDVRDVRRALALGALGYVAKSASATTLVAALHLVLGGDIYVPPFVVRATAEPVAPDRRDALTERQNQVLAMLAAELSNKQIADRLKLSEKTVKAHVTAILRALDVPNRGAAARIARAD